MSNIEKFCNNSTEDFMDPTEDFTLWSQLFINSLTIQSDYTSYISDCTDLLFSILETGELPEPIQNFTKIFLDSIVPKSVNLLLQIAQETEEELDINMGFLSALFSVCAWGAQNKKSTIYQYIPHILDKNSIFFLFNPTSIDLFKSAVDLFYDCGNASIIFCILDDANLQSLDSIFSILHIFYICSPYKDIEEPKNKIINLFDNFFVTLQDPNEFKKLNEKLFYDTYKVFISIVSMKKWNLNLKSFFGFVYSAFKSEVLEKQIFVSTIFCTFLLKLNIESDHLIQLKEWCEQSNFIQFLVGKDFNENELPYLSSIFQYFSEHRLLPPNIIELLWQRILQVHISQKEKYIMITVNMMKFIPINELRLFFDEVTKNDNLFSDEVLKLLSHSLISLNYLISSQIASLLFRKAQTNEKVKKVLFDAVNDKMPITTLNFIGNLCFALIEDQTPKKQNTENENKTELAEETKTNIENENKTELAEETKTNINTDNSEIKAEIETEKETNKKEQEDSNKIESETQKDRVEQKEVNKNSESQIQLDFSENKNEKQDEKDQKTKDNNPQNLIFAENLLRLIISKFNKTKLPFIHDFENQLVHFLPYNRSVFFELIAQYNIQMNKSVTTELFNIFITELDDPLWNFFCHVFCYLGRNAVTDQVFDIIPSIIEKYDFKQATISFSSFLKYYLIFFNQKHNKIVTKQTNFSTDETLPTQFLFTNPPLIGTDILFQLLSDAKDPQVASFVTDVLFMFLTNFAEESERDALGTIKNILLPIIINDDSSNELKGRYLNLLFSILLVSEKMIELNDFGYEHHSVYKSQKVIVTIKYEKIEKRYLFDKTDNISLITKRLSKLYNEAHIFLSYKGNSIEENTNISFYDVVNNEITFNIIYSTSPFIVPDLSIIPSVFLTNEHFQKQLFKLINIEETSEISKKILDYLPNELSVVSLVLDPSKVIDMLNNEEIDFNYVKYCLQTLIDQLIFGDYKSIKKTFSEFIFLDKLIIFCKEFKEKSEKILYEILRIFYFLFSPNDDNCTNDLIALLFNAILNDKNEITIRSAAYLYNKIISLIPNTDSVINNLGLFEKVISKSNKYIWPSILDTTKLLKKINPIFEMVIQQIEQINSVNYQNFVDLFTSLIPLVPSDIVNNNVFDKCISVLLHEKGSTFISLCEVAVSIIDSKSNELNTINPNIITQLLSRALQCDSSIEQKASFNLCISLIDTFPSCLDNVQKILFEFFKNPPDFWNYSPYQIEKKIEGYAGLTNLGATCYMNSVFQQLFNCTQFRDLLFQEINQSENQDNGLTQIFDIFVNMLFGKKGYIETNEFCKVFKGWGKQLINTREQQDAVEFMNLFLDQLPESLQAPFKGTFIHKLVDFNDSICSSNEENFFALSIDIKRFSTIEESFNSFLKYELFTGENQIFSDELGKKIDAKKYTRIKTAPPNLVLHLKRFEYSRSTYNYIKIKSRFEVPQTIDITPLLQDESNNNNNVENNEMNKYSLKGCVLHEGNANAGHYISLVKNKDQLWIKCNDRQITPFNFNDFERETYGGESNSFCAYLLFYTRDNEQKETTIEDEFNLLNQSLKTKIEEENKKFLDQQSIFSKNMIYLASHLQSTEIMTDYFINIFAHSSNGDDSYIISERLKENIHKNQKEKWLIDHLISIFDSIIKPIYLNCTQQSIISSLNELFESTFSSLTESDIFPLANIFVDHFVNCLSWRSFNYFLYIPLRFIKYYNIKENENWRLSITKKIEEFYQQLISEVVLEEVNLSLAFSILQRITPIGKESSLIKPSLNTKILHSHTNYSHYFNFIIVTKQKYQINDIFKYYLNLNSNQFNSVKFIRLIINVMTNSDYDASSRLFKSNRSVQEIQVAMMFLYYIRMNKPNLKEALIQHFMKCICPLLLNFNDDIPKLAISIILELFDTVTPSTKLKRISLEEHKPSVQIKWIPKNIENVKETNLDPPKEMFLVLNQTMEFLRTELIPNSKRYYYLLEYFSAVLIWFLKITNDYKFEYFTTILDMLNSYKMNLKDYEFSYEYIVSILAEFPVETTSKLESEYLQTIFYGTKNFVFLNSKCLLFFKCALKSSDKMFKSYFEDPKNYEYIKRIFLSENYENVDNCMKRIIELFPEKLTDFENIFTDFCKSLNFHNVLILLSCNIIFPVELLQSTILYFISIFQRYNINIQTISKILPGLIDQIEKIPDFQFKDDQISDEVFYEFLRCLSCKFNFEYDQPTLDNLWKFTTLLMTKIPHFQTIFCDFTRVKEKNSLILRYFEFITQFEKEPFENEVVKFLEVLSLIKIDSKDLQFNQGLLNVIKKIENLETLNNYLTTIFTLNDVYKNQVVEEMARFILSKLNDDQINEIIDLLSFQFDTKYQFIYNNEYTPIFNALSLICDAKPDFYKKVISSIPFTINVWANWNISERSKNILLSKDP